MSLTVLAACSSGADSTDSYPSKDLDWTVAFGPGGGNDRMSREIVDILTKEKLYPGNIVVNNREGGSGATGWGFVNKHKGEGYFAATASGSMITTPLQSDTGWSYLDFTLVGLFATEDALFMVPADSPYETWQDWVDYAKTQDRVVVGGTSTVSVNYMLLTQLADKAGYTMDYVPFQGGGDAQIALLSHSIEATMDNPAEVLGQIEAKKMRPLLFTGPERIANLPDVPTAAELGFGELPTQPYGLVLPPDVGDDVRDWWVATMKKVVATPRWQEFLDGASLSKRELWGEEYSSYLGELNEQFTALLKEQGAIN